MQSQLPIFPQTTKLITSSVGFHKKGSFIYYMLNGSPIFCHSQEDKDSYRFIMANLVVTGLCTPKELSDALGVRIRTIQRYAKEMREKGSGCFFNREDNRGQCYKMTENKIQEVQRHLDMGATYEAAGAMVGVSENTVAYHIKKGTLKKKTQ